MTATTDPIQELLKQLHDSRGSDAAIQLLAKAADAHPTDARPLLLLAAEFAEQKQFDRAEAAYLSALQRSPNLDIARFQLGLLQFTSGRPAVAMLTWAPLDALGVENPLLEFKRSFESLALNDFEGARAHLQRGIAANTSNAPLNRDMHAMLDLIIREQQQESNSLPSEPPASENHFLVSAYKTLH
jgi:tetratricopeptide (TPR) repeat protein